MHNIANSCDLQLLLFYGSHFLRYMYMYIWKGWTGRICVKNPYSLQSNADEITNSNQFHKYWSMQIAVQSISIIVPIKSNKSTGTWRSRRRSVVDKRTGSRRPFQIFVREIISQKCWQQCRLQQWNAAFSAKILKNWYPFC